MRANSILLIAILFGMTLNETSTLAQSALAQSTPPVDPQTWTDHRMTNLKTLDDHFPFDVPNDPATWYQRSNDLRRRVLVATGLWPMPEKTPLRPKIFGKTVRDGFTVEKVAFESLPGHYVTGLLFRPGGDKVTDDHKYPGVLSPHGHGGRNQAFTDTELAGQLATGGEHFAASGRTPKLARCATLARMGCVTFIFDMIGYGDSVQIPMEVAHRHADPRPEETRVANLPDGWPFFSIDADLRLQSIMGLQTWNAIRALDFLASLPDVDANRLAVTGGSGGGTQSILLGAIDDRIKVSFPNGMVSTSMQGGCYCENCNLLRVGTGNVELAALFAPRPQAMTAADDWTVDMMTDGYPQLEWLYAMIGDERDVQCRPLLQFKHNYNYVTRATMYQWMNRHLGLGLYEPIVEQDFVPLTERERTVWDGTHPKPNQTGIEHERAICRWFDDQANQRLKWDQIDEPSTAAAFRIVVGGAWRTIFDVPRTRDAGAIGLDRVTDAKSNAELVTEARLFDPARGAIVPITIHGDIDAKSVLVWTGETTDLISDLVGSGNTVVVTHLLGPHAIGRDDQTTQPLVNDPRDYSAFTFGYNPTMAAHRCADLMTVIEYFDQRSPRRLGLIANRGSAAWAAMASVLAGDRIEEAIIDTDGFRFSDVNTYRDIHFIPGAVKYGDLPAVLALRSPHRLCLVESEGLPKLVADVYAASGASTKVEVVRSLRSAASQWLE